MRISRRPIDVLIVTAAFIIRPGYSTAQTLEPREYPVFRVIHAPTIDGAVDDEAWTGIPIDRAFVTPYVGELNAHLPAYKQTAFMVGFDDNNLFVAVIANEPWTKYLKDDEPSTPFQQDDGVEIWIGETDDGQIRTFIVNATGRKSSPEVRDLDWEAATHVDHGRYTVEVRIPFSALGGKPDDGDTWRANILRNTATITSPEDLVTSWSPLPESLVDTAGFGRFVFRYDTLTLTEVEGVEEGLAAESAKILALETAAWRDVQEREEQLARRYQEHVDEAMTGFRSVTKGPADLIEPPSTPEGEVWRYGLGFPLQIGPATGALLTNIRLEGSGNIDFEIGTDVILFDDLDDIEADGAIPVSRYERYVDPERGPVIVRKGPIIGGFVPLGALLEDGTPHPAAGTGFGICWSIAHEMDEDGKFEYTEYFERSAMLYQFAYDGEQFRILDERKIDASVLLPNWKLVGNFVTNAIPDGEDLLYVMVARVGEVSVAGYTRWRYDGARWHPVSFTPVTGYDVTWSEPSLIRDANGHLLFSARSYDRAVPVIAFDIAVWRSTDNGATWSRVLYEKNRRARSPVSINRTVDGTPFVAGNTPPLRRTREVLSIWPLDETRSRLEGRVTARDAPSEFGPAPSGSWWRIDHPTSAVLRLADGEWHSVLVYRIVDNGEVEGDAPPAPQTGCYVEEVFSAGEPVPVWRFR